MKTPTQNPVANPPKVSIIIPVYNAEVFLHECLDSILHQSLREIEIICVDDGSTDASLKLLREYQNRDERLIIIEQSNKKQGAARNQGLKVATGEYIQFVDSDDYIDLNTCEKLYTKCKSLNLDMLSFRGTNFDNNTKEILNTPYYEFKYLPNDWDKEIFTYQDCLPFLPKMAVSAALTIYKREFLLHKNIRFPEKLYFEDNVFFIKAITQAKRVSIDKTLYYFRRIQPNSTTQNWNRHFNDYLVIIDILLRYLKTADVDDNIYRLYRTTYIRAVKSRYENFSTIEQKKFRKPFYRLIKLYSENKWDAKDIFKAYLLFPKYLWELTKLKKDLSNKKRGNN